MYLFYYFVSCSVVQLDEAEMSPVPIATTQYETAHKYFSRANYILRINLYVVIYKVISYDFYN